MNLVEKVSQVVLNICLMLVLYVGGAIFLPIVLVPVYLCRLIVSQLSIFHPDLSKLIPARSHNHAIDEIYTKPKCSILLSNVAKGMVDIETIRNLLFDKMVNVRNENGEFRYMEGKQYPYRWLGFMFWKWEKNFDICDHVNYYKDTDPGIPTNCNSKFSQAKLRKLEAELVSKAYAKEKSPWEIIVVKNVETDPETSEEHTMLYLRFHHSLCDGFSWMKIFHMVFFTEGTEKTQVINMPKFEKLTTYGMLLYGLKMAVIGPYQGAKHLLEAFDFNDWKIPENQLSDKMHFSLSKRISLNLLKDIRRAHGVSLNALIYSAFATAMRKAMMKKNGRVPKDIHCVIPFPIPGHPDDKFVNHASLAFIKLPIEETHSLTRLKMTQNNLENLIKSYVPLLSFYVSGVYGSLFSWMTKILQTNMMTTVGGTSFPGSKCKLYLREHEVIDYHLSIGQFPGNTAVMFTTVTHIDSLRINIAVNSSIIENQADVDEIQADLLDEIRLLQNYASLTGPEVLLPAYH